MSNYYRRFIENYSGIARPLYDLTKKNIKFGWNQKAQTAFMTLKERLTSEPILRHPDFSKHFYIVSDASIDGIGRYLSQKYEEIYHPISYARRGLSDTEKRYSTRERELLAMIYCAQQFRYCVQGRKFTFLTDHRPLVWLHSMKAATSRLKKWYFKLCAEYEFDVQYIPGRINYVADALSRNPGREMLSVNVVRKRRDSASTSDSESPSVKPVKKVKAGAEKEGNDEDIRRGASLLCPHIIHSLYPFMSKWEKRKTNFHNRNTHLPT